LPLGLGLAAIAGLMLWLGSNENDEPAAAPEPPALSEQIPQRPEESLPSTEPEARAVPAELRPAVTAAAAETAPATAEDEAPTPAATASDEPAPSATAPSAAASVAARADEANAGDAAKTGASETPPQTPTPSAGEPVPSDEGLTEGPVTTIYMAPDCAELYRKGKRVGRSGVRVRTPEGKKRVYEVVCPGHGTRKLTLDGSHKELMIGLRRK
jgi:hypothetical protein